MRRSKIRPAGARRFTSEQLIDICPNFLISDIERLLEYFRVYANYDFFDIDNFTSTNWATSRRVQLRVESFTGYIDFIHCCVTVYFRETTIISLGNIMISRDMRFMYFSSARAISIRYFGRAPPKLSSRISRMHIYRNEGRGKIKFIKAKFK